MQEFDVNGDFPVPFMEIPSCRLGLAMQTNVHKKIMFIVTGGLGDRICAVPVIQWAMRVMKDVKFYLTTENPELFSHLKFKEVFNIKTDKVKYDNYYTFVSLYKEDHFHNEFINHFITHCVDSMSLNMFRCQIPVADKEIKLPKVDFIQKEVSDLYLDARPIICIHPGKHWPSKTIPGHYWNEVLKPLKKYTKPIIIGADMNSERTTVDIDTDGCIDLRNKLSILETISLLDDADVLLTNDSAPLHMAAAGTAWVGFLATVKHPDHLMHWRQGEFGWRMKNFASGGMYDLVDCCPNHQEKVTLDKCTEDQLMSWLPKPQDFADWAIERSLL